MRMLTLTLGLGLGVVLGFVVCAFAFFLAPSAEALPPGVRGAGDLGMSRQTFRWRNSQNNLRTATIDRTEVVLPSDYGKLVQIVSDGSRTNFWFLDGGGRMRNVTLDPGLYQVSGVETVWDSSEDGEGGR